MALVVKSKSKKRWGVSLRFSFCFHKKDRPPPLGGLEQIQIFFKGVGGITDGIDDLVQYNVSAIADIIHVVIPHFEKYPLLTPLAFLSIRAKEKYSDFRLFKSIAELVYNKEHLTESVGVLNKVLSLKASLNKGLSLNLKQSFPPLGIIAIERPKVSEDSIINPYWIAGSCGVRLKVLFI